MAEGTWTSCTAYQIAVHLASIEEQEAVGLSTTHVIATIGWTMRPRLVSAHLEDASTVTVVYAPCGCAVSQCEEVRTDTFKVNPCEHQTKLPANIGSIGEYGGSEGYVRESDCTCFGA